MSATSSSDRYAKAREAAAGLDAVIHRLDIDPYDHNHRVRAIRARSALLSLITPPPTLESPEQIAERIILERGLSSSREEWEIEELREHLSVAVHAGIDAAWESWEPETGAAAQGDTPEGWPMTLEEYRRWASSHWNYRQVYFDLYDKDDPEASIEQDYWDGPDSWAFPVAEKEA